MSLGTTRLVNGRFGALFVALDATPTGSDANNDVVADFSGATATQFPDVSLATVVTHTPSQTLGSVFHINAAGVWHVKAEVPVATAATVVAALNMDGIAADLSIDPAPGNIRNRAFSRWVGAAAGDGDTAVVEATVIITEDMARDPLGLQGAIRLLLSNGAGAGAAAASLAPLGNARIEFEWCGPVGQQLT